MSKSSINTYLNENNDIVLVYATDIEPFATVQPDHIVIKETDLHEVIEELQLMQYDIGE